MDESWSIVESSFRVATAKAYEGLFTQGSGYMHVRGSLEEHLAGAPQNVSFTRMPANVTSEKFPETKVKWGTYVPGVFGRHPLLNNEMINLPFFLDLAPVVEGEKLDVEACRVEGYRRELRLDNAVLARTLTWHTRFGAKVTVRFERFLSLARPSLCVQRMTLTSDRDVTVAARGGIDADVRTNGYDHFKEISLAPAEAGCLACRVLTDAGDEVRIVTRLSAPGATWKHLAAGRTAKLEAELALPAGGTLVVEKRTAVATSRDLKATDPAALLRETSGLSYETLLEEHAAAWRERWAKSDVVIEGDAASQRAMRVSIYHLLRSHVTGDSRVAVDAKGYAGDAYWGRYFWDTEMYLMPFHLYTDPPRAKALADFRMHSLAGARANAASFGYPGARYAWESDADGNECCPNWQYRDHEVHVTADVAFGMVHYARATNDPTYLRGPAAKVLVETARYWMRRMDRRSGEDRYSLLGVMGPDEYTPISHNNSYTNRMVSFALAAAAEAAPAVNAPKEDAEAFARAAASLPITRREDGFVLQCEDWDLLAEPRFEELWLDRNRGFASQVSQERLYRSKCLKQADVLMMMWLFGQEFSDEEVRRAWDYYLPYTTHDSSLSAGAHAIIACRLGMDEEAWRYWQMSCGLDLDVEHGGAAEGIHIAAAGANWQIAVLGFAGVATAMQSEALSLRPRLPKAWTRLAFPIVWKGAAAYVDIRRDFTLVKNTGAQPLAILLNGKPYTVPARGEVKG